VLCGTVAALHRGGLHCDAVVTVWHCVVLHIASNHTRVFLMWVWVGSLGDGLCGGELFVFHFHRTREVDVCEGIYIGQVLSMD
jgi:hypothetical protein